MVYDECHCNCSILELLKTVSDELFVTWKQDPAKVELLSQWVSQLDSPAQQKQAIALLESCKGEFEGAISASVQVALVNLSLKLGNLAQSDAYVNDLHALQPDNFQPYYFKARILTLANKHNEAMEAYKQALRKQRGHLESWRGLADSAERKGDPNGALGYLTEAKQQDWQPAASRSLTYKQGCIYQRMRRYPLALVSFTEVILDCVVAGIPRREAKKPRLSQVPPQAPLAALTEAVKLLEGAGLQPFPAAGTLLGWWREGNFLSHDKDVDITLPPGSNWDKAVSVLSGSPVFMPVPNEMGYSSLFSALHRETGICVDIGQHEKVGEGQVGSVWRIPGEADEHCRQTRQSEYRLVRDEWLGEQFWRPEDPDVFLTEIYGDWRTPETSFDTVISGRHILGFPDCVRCYAYNRLAHVLSQGDANKAVSYVAQILQKDPLDPVSNHLKIVLQKRQGDGPR